MTLLNKLEARLKRREEKLVVIAIFCCQFDDLLEKKNYLAAQKMIQELRGKIQAMRKMDARKKDLCILEKRLDCWNGAMVFLDYSTSNNFNVCVDLQVKNIFQR